MTGFGRALVDFDAGGARGRLRVEIRSVNHRGLDLKIRAPQPDAFCEAEIGRAVRAAVERGSVTVHVREDAQPARAGVDEARARQVHAALEKLRGALGIAAPVSLGDVAAFMPLGGGSGLEGEALWDALRPGVETALAELVATRRREGAALGEDIRARALRLAALVTQIRAATAALPERYARRI